ncbi:MAG: MerR family transcriptional regulator [Oscillospiraceae bacterium]|nr:MerR family transcriptional regulator [Oscillospiraceae bacterium]
MLKIGMFSKLSRISIRMLRYFDEQGLLTPCDVDACTGYRYYAEEQLPVAERITALQNMGFSLAEVKKLIHAEGQDGVWEQSLLHQRKVLEEEAQAAQYRLTLLETALKQLRNKEEKPMVYHVTVKELPERYVASVRQKIPTYNHESLLWGLLIEETAGQKLQMADPCYSMAIFHDGEYVESNPDVEIQCAVKGTYQDTEHVVFKTVPPVRIASATFKGSYKQVGEVNQAVAGWIRDNGYAFSGASFNIYHVGPAQTRNPEEFVTELCFPVSEK